MCDLAGVGRWKLVDIVQDRHNYRVTIQKGALGAFLLIEVHNHTPRSDSFSEYLVLFSESVISFGKTVLWNIVKYVKWILKLYDTERDWATQSHGMDHMW